MECRTAQRVTKKVNLHIYEKNPLRLKKIRVCKGGFGFLFKFLESVKTLYGELD